MRTLALFIVILVFVSLSGCSAVRTVYNQADHLIAWRADDYFDLTDEQKRLLHARFSALHAWHRSTQLHRYVGLLETADRRLNQGPALRDAAWAGEALREQSRVVMLHAHPDMVALLSTLTDAQLANASRRFERDNRRFAKERGVGASAQEQRRLRAKRLLESIEHWSGPLDSQQQARIGALSEELPLDAAFRHHDRQRRQRDFLGVLELRRDHDRFSARLREWLIDWDASRPADIRNEATRHAEAHAALWMRIYDVLHADQRRRISDRLRWYMEAMRDLTHDPRH